MIFDTKAVADVEVLLEQASTLADDVTVIAKTLDLSPEEAEEVVGILRARRKNAKYEEIKYLLPDDLRFGTHGDVAAWRADRLACSTLIEIGAGVGMQSMAFAKTCRKVVSVEVDHRKAVYARENLRAAGITNVEVIEGDAMQVIGKLPAADIVFLDPARPAQEEVRNLDANFSPPLRGFIKAYSAITPAIAIELPPHTRDIDLPGEREYLSTNGELRRLTLLLGPLAKAERTAVMLPSRAMLQGSPQELPKSTPLARYLFEVEEAVVRAGLVHLLLGKGVRLFENAKTVLLTSDNNEPSPFYRNTFKVAIATDNDPISIQDALRRARARQVVLRTAVDPKRYWQERKKLEQGLTGTETVHLFVVGTTAVIAKKVAAR